MSLTRGLAAKPGQSVEVGGAAVVVDGGGGGGDRADQNHGGVVADSKKNPPRLSSRCESLSDSATVQAQVLKPPQQFPWGQARAGLGQRICGERVSQQPPHF